MFSVRPYIVGPFLLAFAIFATVTELPDRVLSEFALAILKQAGPVEDLEVAAFVVRFDDGTLSLVRWPDRRRFRTAQWSGRLPRGAIAIAIIHSPPTMMPLPSATDRREAKRLRIPIYAVSRGLLCKADIRGQVQCAILSRR